MDIWACGVMMYQLISGRYPFYDKDEAELINFICNDAVSFRHKVFQKIPKEAKELIMRMLAKDPK